MPTFQRVLNSRTLALALTFTIVGTACSGGGSSDGETSDSTTTSPTATTTDQPVAQDTTTTISTTSTAPATSPPTTEPEPVILPPGVVWTESQIGEVGGVNMFVRIGDHWWLGGGYANVPRFMRSSDGVTFETIFPIPSPESGSYGLRGLIERPDGGLLAYGSRGSNCQVNNRRDDGFIDTGLCRRFRGMVYLSDDGGTTWRTTEPSGMAPTSGTSLFLTDMIHDGAQYVAAGYVAGPDWHVRILTSPDGESWQVVNEIRGVDGPITSDRLVFDGQTYILRADEHPCSVPHDTTPGWIRGSTWASHVRVFAGGSPTDLALLGPTDLSLLPERIIYNCADTRRGGDINDPYPNVQVELLNGRITVIDVTVPEDLRDASTYDFALWGNGWEYGSVEGADNFQASRPVHAFEVDGGFALMQSASEPDRASLHRFHVMMPDGSGGFEARSALRPNAPVELRGVYWFEGAIVAGGQLRQPTSTNFEMVPRVWMSVATPEDAVGRCELLPGASCVFANLENVEGYPDFAGLDLSGIDLTYADLAQANFAGATFDGATLQEATSGFAVDFTGVTFVGANLQAADLRNLAGVDLTNANLRFANLRFSDQPILTGAQMSGATLAFSGADDDTPPVISLAGLDLRDTVVRADILTDIMIISDLRGAILDGVRMNGVDLTNANVEGVDVSLIRFDDDSICPAGMTLVEMSVVDFRCL